MLYPKFKKYIEKKFLFAPGDRVVVAVSGGIDSMVLLDLLFRASKEFKLELVVAHVNHRLRGKESLRDEAFVKKTADNYQITFKSRSLPPKKGTNIQNEARRLRYAFLAELSRNASARSIATAHHADDQAETVLLHLVRGAGLSGLSGMKASSEYDGVRIVRPLLFASKKEILSYAKLRSLKHVEDRTNKGTKYSRNVIRHKILPELVKMNPKFIENVSETAERISDENELLYHVAREALKHVGLQKWKGEYHFSITEFLDLPRALSKNVFRLLYHEASGSTVDLGHDHIDKMLQIVSSDNKRGSYRLPNKWKFMRDGNIAVLRLMATSHDRK